MFRFVVTSSHDTNGQNHGLRLKIQWSLLNEICTVTHLPRGKDSSKKFDWDLEGEKYRIGNVCLLKGLFLSVYVDKMSGKTQHMAPMWKALMKSVDHHQDEDGKTHCIGNV